MAYIIAVSKKQKNVLTSSNPNDFIFHSSYNTFKIIASGNLINQTVSSNPTIFTVNHGFSYTPLVYGFAKFSDGYVAQADDKERADNTPPIERYWKVEVNNTQVRFIFYKGQTSNYNVSVRYYLFEPPL